MLLVKKTDLVCGRVKNMIRAMGCKFGPVFLQGFADGVHCTVRTNDYLSKLSDTPVTVSVLEPREDPALVERFHRWLLQVHFKLLFKYLVTLGPIRKFFKTRHKNREF